MKLLRRAAFIACAALLSGPALAGASLQDDLQKLLVQERLSGAVFATVIAGKTSVGSVGHSHAPSATALANDARVQVGSVAKTLIALSVLRLVSQGRLDLDAPLQGLLPALSSRNPWQASHPLRLRHLLDHTAGLEDMRLWHLFNRQHQADMPLAASLMTGVDLLQVRTPPGTRTSYSNMGYTLAGMVIESVTAQRYEDWGRDELLRPLGMQDSSFHFATQQGPQADGRLAWGHLDDLSPQAALALGARPAGQFTTTAADMARLAQFLMSDGRIDGKPFIRTDLLRAMGRPRDTDAARAGLHAGYALGLATRDRHGAVGLCHDGSVVGFRATLCIYPDQQSAFFIAFNTDSETARHSLFNERLVQALGLPPRAGAVAPALGDTREWEGRYVLAPNRFQGFALLDRLFSSQVFAAAEAGALWRGRSLLPAGPGLLRQSDRVQATHALGQSADGQHWISDGAQTWARLHPLRFWGPVLSLAAASAALAYWLLMPPWLRWRQGRSLWQPAWLGVMGLLAALAAMVLQHWSALGELTLGSGAMAAATALLPALLVWQLFSLAVPQAAGAPSSHRGQRIADAVAAGALLQGFGLLAAWGLWPLALWR